MNKQIDLNDVVHAILRGMMDQHPSEITIGDFKLNCFYIASAAGKKHLAPTFQQATLKLAEWIEMYGLDHLSFSLWSIDEEGQQPNGQICHPTKYSTCLFTTIC